MTPGPVGAVLGPVPDTATQHDVRMRDGVRLATDVYLPEGEGAFPAILVRLPYDKNSRYVFMDVVARRATAAGYALVVQDVRGKYRSEGEPLGPVNEADDGYDTIDWIASEQWCDGRVGMFGDSYYGQTQYAAVASSHPALRAIVPRVTATDFSISRPPRAGDVADVPWMIGALYLQQSWTGRYANDLVPDFGIRPLTAAFDRVFDELGERSSWFDSTLPHGTPTRAFPYGHPYDARAIPTLHCVGWWDNLLIPHMRDVEQFAARPAWAALQYLWMDSIDHENYRIEEAGTLQDGDHDNDDDALERLMDIYIEPALRFFDVFLKDQGSPSDIPRVQWNLAHVGYRDSETWPPAGAVTTSLFLEGLADMTGAGGRLSATAPDSAESGTWSFDPENPIVSPVENSFAFLAEYPDERETAARPDVAVFDSEPSAEHLDLAGPAFLHTRVSSTAHSADVFVRVLDVAPDGGAHLVLRGQAEVITPDGSTEYRIELGHVGYRLKPGHRLRLQISSSDFPEYTLNPGTGENRWTAVEFLAAEQTLRTDPAAPARLELTVLP